MVIIICNSNGPHSLVNINKYVITCAAAVDRCTTASVGEAREALMNVAVDVLSAHRLAQNLPVGSVSAALHAPHALKILPLLLLALLKRVRFLF